jgi:hypothetical protein
MSATVYVAAVAGAEDVNDEGEGPHLTRAPFEASEGDHHVTSMTEGSSILVKWPRDGAEGDRNVIAGDDARRVGATKPPPKT